LKTTLTIEPAQESLAPFFALLVERIEGGSADAIHELRIHFLRGVKYLLARQFGPDRSDDLTQDVLAEVIDAIRNGEIRQPERLPAFVQMVVQKTIASARDYPRPDAGTGGVSWEDRAEADRILHSLPAKDREILVRFYCQEQPADQICREMDVTAEQFHAIKNRARVKFAWRAAKRKNI
jgi:DNA-directed RNA polymerase specialized sigma24 family protein